MTPVMKHMNPGGPILYELFGKYLQKSATNIYAGEGKWNDYTSIGSTFAGGPIAKGVSSIPKLIKGIMNPQVRQAIKLMKSGTHNSPNPNLVDDLLDPMTYQAGKEQTLGNFTHFSVNPMYQAGQPKYGPNAYKPKLGIKAYLAMLKSNGFATTTQMAEYGVPNVSMYGLKFNNPAVQAAIKDGFIGTKYLIDNPTAGQFAPFFTGIKKHPLGGIKKFHKGGAVGHRHGRNLPLTQEQKARKNKNLSYYESKIDDPINNYSDGSAKVFTHSPFGIFAPLTALAADLFGVYFQGKSPGFGKNGAADLNPKSYETNVSALMKSLLNPYGEIAKGSATKGDWANAALNFVPGAGAVKGVNVLRARSAAYNVIDKAAMGLPSDARVSLLPNAKLRNNFVALKKEGDLNSPEFAKARYELALSDALRAAKRNKFTALPDLKNTTAANLIEENKNLPKFMEEPIKVEGQDYIFRFQKGDILPTDAPYIDKFIAGLKEGKATSKTFSGGMHQAEILDPITKKQLSWVNYDPVTGYVSYRGTHMPYRSKHLSDALWNKAVSITRIRHSDNLTDMGRPSALRIGGFMADDPYYGAVTSIPNLKQYLDMLMKIGKSKNPKPSTGEPPLPGGIGNPLGFRPTSQPSSNVGVFGSDSNRFNDRNSIIGFQDDRLLYWNSADELRSSLRPEVVKWFGSPYRTSANFPYGHNGYIESGALPELERILALERSAAKFANNSYLPRITFANGGLAQNFSNSSLKNLGIPKFEDGINMVPANMLAQLHKNEAVIPANMNPFNPNATAAATGSVYNINVELNGTNLTAKDVALEIRNEMRIKEMTAGINRNVGRV
jgi:hypothetical protein